MKTPHYNVIIATPGLMMQSQYVQSLIETTKWLGQQGMTYKYVNKFSSFVASAREKTATDSDEHDWETTEIAGGSFTYDWILWIDSDIVWKPSVLERLFSHNLDVVSAVVPASAQGAITAMRLNPMGEPRQIVWTDLALDDEPVEVDGVGFGMVAIKYGVFEGTPRPWFIIRKARIEGVHYPINYGEDYSACLNMKDAGFKIWLDPLARVEHIKQVNLTI
jgi:hypothetical protein